MEDNMDLVYNLLKKVFKKIKDITLNMKVKQKIITIYLIGGLIPLIFLATYLINGTKKIVIEQTKTSVQSELTSMVKSLMETMRIVTDVSIRMYFDEELEHIAFHQYKNYYEVITDYQDYLTQDWMSYYYKEIENIRIYVDNPTITTNNRFVKIDDTIKQKAWYQETINANGSSVWNYIYDDVTRKNYLCLTRLIRTKENQDVGVLAIALQNDLIESLVKSRPYETAIIMNDDQLVMSNSKDTDKEEIFQILKNYKKNNSERVTYKGEDCVLSIKEISYSKTKSRGVIISLQPYREVLAAANERSREGFAFIIGSVFLSLLLILFFSDRFSVRVKLFQKQMHKAATGNFHIPIQMEGNDEIGLLYDDLYTMIDSIKKLYATIYEEKLQKEKLNSRQKDVEFKMLASQINPHFLYNTLETIRMKARCINQPEIEELVKMLAKIMRRNIEVGDKLVTLKSEMDLVEYYLKIQKYRFGDKITYTIDSFCDYENYKIIPLIIQPLVENAFVHGLETKEGTGEIYIYTEEKDNLVIHIIDNGVGISEEKLVEIKNNLNDYDKLDRSNIGLSNVNQRIRLLYGDEYGITITSKLNVGTAISIVLPKGAKF
jgi:two-component system, sensor histidine kinase YesM